jgi:hypothetical protein
MMHLRAITISTLTLILPSPAHSDPQARARPDPCWSVQPFDLDTRSGSDYRTFQSTPAEPSCRVELQGRKLKPVVLIVRRAPVVVPKAAPIPREVARPRLWPAFQEWIADFVGERG